MHARFLPLRSLLCAAALAAALLLGARPAAAQTRGTVELIVTDAETGAPLSGARVRVDGEVRGTSDAAGRVLLEELDAGSHLLTVEMIGRRALQPQVELAPGQVLELEVMLDSDAIPMPAITARAEPVADGGSAVAQALSRRRGSGIFIGREQIRRSRASRISDLLGKVPGVRVVYGSSGAVASFPGGAPAAALGGAGHRCVAQVYLDGVLMRTPAVDIVAVQELESVEVYLRVIPAEYGGGNSGCGVIVLRTRTQ
ncbi:MAG TPA: carboxypeptidase regulatory-like domain-containing protein [Longimicrobium sp.]